MKLKLLCAEATNKPHQVVVNGLLKYIYLNPDAGRIVDEFLAAFEEKPLGTEVMLGGVLLPDNTNIVFNRDKMSHLDIMPHLKKLVAKSGESIPYYILLSRKGLYTEISSYNTLRDIAKATEALKILDPILKSATDRIVEIFKSEGRLKELSKAFQ